VTGAGLINLAAAPPTIALACHAVLPTELHGGGRPSAWARREHGRDQIPSFLEGPVIDGSGNLFVVDIAWGRILRCAVDGTFEVLAEYAGEPNGLAFAADGTLVIADHQLGLLALAPGTSTPRVLLDSLAGEPFLGLNDLVFGASGSLYFTDQGATGLHDPRGRVLRLDPDGRCVVLLDGIPSPNGIAVSGAEDRLYVAVTRDNSVWRVPITSDGSVTKVGRFLQFSGGIGPDGLHLDQHGRLYVAHLGLGTVWVVDHTGVPVARLYAPAGLATTNVTADASRVYVTESETGAILTTEVAPW
jgi:gluconolactonase